MEDRMVRGMVAAVQKVRDPRRKHGRLHALVDEGATVTADAMACQREIAEEIRKAGADYVLAVKGNQESTLEAVVDAFTPHLESDEPPRGTVYRTSEKAHGRTEFREYHSVPAPDSLRNKGWKDVRSIGMVFTRREEGERVSEESRYYLSSLRPHRRLRKDLDTAQATPQLEPHPTHGLETVGEPPYPLDGKYQLTVERERRQYISYYSTLL